MFYNPRSNIDSMSKWSLLVNDNISFIKDKLNIFIINLSRFGRQAIFKKECLMVSRNYDSYRDKYPLG